MRPFALALAGLSSVLAASIAAHSRGAGDPPAAPPAPAASPSFDAAVFAASHNSYSPGDAKPPILTQLDAGVRFIELDIFNDNYALVHDQLIGHDRPGDAVERSAPNPPSLALTPWLEMIRAWCDAHPGHAPITLALDIKRNLAEAPDAEGGLWSINEQVSRVFGERLFTAEAMGDAWPTLDALRGKVLLVLSGDLDTRIAYRWQCASSAAVAMNAAGQVVEVHEHDGLLMACTGRYLPDGHVRWLHRTPLGQGSAPAVALSDAGLIALVYQSATQPTLLSRLGTLTGDDAPTWFAAERYDTGLRPVITFNADGTLRELHQSERHNQNWMHTATTDLPAGVILWSGSIPTADTAPDPSTASAGDRRVTLSIGAAGDHVPGVLVCTTPAVANERVRPRQLGFAEYQRGDDELLENDHLWFFAGASSAHGAGEWAVRMHEQHHAIVRLWAVKDEATLRAIPPCVQLAATDEPVSPWYQAWLKERHAAK